MQQSTGTIQTMQGIAVPNAVVAPQEFFRRTRRLTFPMVSNKSFAGLGASDVFSFLQTGIVAGVEVRLTGSVVTVKGAGTVATTARWPYDFVKKLRVSANGQSNLVNCSGWKLKAHDMMSVEQLSDRGVSQSINNATVTQGTLSMNSESWGLGQGQTAIADATYNFDLFMYVPIAYDRRSLVGAIFAQTTATDLTLTIDWASQSDILALTGNAAATVTCTVQAEVVAFAIPEEAGQIIIPDLSNFHGLIENRNTAIATGDNEIRLVGQGVGRQLLRVYGQTWNGAASAPLSLIDTNYGAAAWRYGGNDTPETAFTARELRQRTERIFNSDLGASQGFWVWDWAAESAFRDSIDEGSVTELRVLLNIPNALGLSNPAVEYVQETVFAGAIGA